MATWHFIGNLALLSVVLLAPSKGSAHSLQLGIAGLREIKNGGCRLLLKLQRETSATGVVGGDGCVAMEMFQQSPSNTTFDHHRVRGPRRTLPIVQLCPANNTPETPGETETAWLRGLGLTVDD